MNEVEQMKEAVTAEMSAWQVFRARGLKMRRSVRAQMDSPDEATRVKGVKAALALEYPWPDPE